MLALLSRFRGGEASSDDKKKTALAVAAVGAAAFVGYRMYSQARATGGHFRYPAARRANTREEFHGRATVADPYRWMEDVDSAETRAWVGEQQQLTTAVLAQCPDRERFAGRLRELYNYDKFGCPYRRGARFFQARKAGLQNQFVYYKMGELGAAGEVLLDVNALRADGTAALKFAIPSDDGETLGYGVSYSGSDWTTIHVRDVETCEDAAEETIEWVKFSGLTWLGTEGFFYARYPAPAGVAVGSAEADGAEGERHAGTETDAASGQMLYFHKRGTPASQDVLIYSDPEHPQWMFGTDISDDRQTLIITVGESCDPVNRVFYADLSQWDRASPLGKVVKLIDTFEDGMDFVANNGRTFYFRTNRQAARYRIVRMRLPEVGAPEEDDVAALARIPLEEVVPEQQHVLESVGVAGGDKLIMSYVRDCKEEVDLVELTTGRRLGTVALAEPGMVAGLRCRREYSDVYFTTSGFLDPGTAYAFDVEGYGGGDVVPRVVQETEVAGFDRSQFATEQRWFTSKDGTRVPMFVIRGAGAAEAGPRPTVLYGYGGFNISLLPSFSISRLLWVRHFGGVFVVANLRGGGEFGDDWHKAGCGAQKQNVFDDFYAAAEYLTAEGVTDAEHLGIMGGSNGGLLVCASITQRPELFSAAIAQVPVTDMLRFHRWTIGYAWISDYGSADEDFDQFSALYAYSPVHNCRAGAGRVPSTMVLTADHDDRVVPCHSFKFVAALQHALRFDRSQTRPQIIRIESKAGHGAGKPTEKIIEEAADTYGFLAKATGASWVA